MSDDNNQKTVKNKSFFSTLFKSINTLRLVISNVIFFLLFFLVLEIFTAIPAEKKKPVKKLKEDMVLLVAPSGVAVETDGNVLPMNFIQEWEKSSLVKISDLTKAIKNAAYDRRIKSLCIDFSNLTGLSSAHLTEIGEALAVFKMTEKKIYAYATDYSVPSYFLASYADKIGLDPLGEVSFVGFVSRPLFYKNAEDKFGIKWNALHAGEFKGAAETYLREDFSQNVKNNLTELFDGLWTKYVFDVAKNRNMSETVIRNFAENYNAVLKKYKGDCALAAFGEGLITDVVSADDFYAQIGFANFARPKDDAAAIEYSDYNVNYLETPSKNSVAVIHLDGAITSSNIGLTEAAVSSKIIELFDIAQRDVTVKAVVLRIDSGGGEVLASEEIRRAVERTKLNIPVVVSMGTTAASGAYWIASGADYIFASPYTITGSIGVFAVMPSFKNFIENKLGITSDLVYSGQKPMYSPFDNFSKTDLEVQQLQVTNIYTMFINKVANGRKLSEEKVASIAGGRVYSGQQALNLKLVDNLGSLNDAIHYAASMANIENDFSPKVIKRPMTFTEEFMKNLFKQTNSSFIKSLKLSDFRAIFEFLNLNSKNNIYIYNPERLTW